MKNLTWSSQTADDATPHDILDMDRLSTVLKGMEHSMHNKNT